MKQLLAYGIPDIYTGKTMIPFEELQQLIRRKVALFPLKQFVKLLGRYHDCFQDVPAEIFGILKKQSKINPKAKLEEVIQSLVPEHNKKLVKVQQPIFEELQTIAKGLPSEYLEQFNELMSVTESQIQNEEIHKPFNAEDFRYKLKRIIDRNKSRNISQEMRDMRKLYRLALELFEDSNKEVNTNRTKNQKKSKNPNARNRGERNSKSNAAIIDKMGRILKRSSLANDKELVQLLRVARAQVSNAKVSCPFQRKAFIIQLSNIVEGLSDKHLAHRLVQCASKLPNSSENVSAFIVKSAESSAEKILYDLLYPSVGSIEHIKPSKTGGKDNIYNYALASALVNSNRAHMSFANWLRKHPETYKNCQKYVDRLIELCHDGVFKEVGLSRDYILHFASLVQSMSPKEKPLILDSSALKRKKS